MTGLYLSQSQVGRCYLNSAQKQSLKQLLLLEQRLKHPEYPGAVKGLEGMRVAQQILQERKACGVLIGGLAEAVWNQRRTEEELYQHKDVDVLVLDEVEIDKFEGGVDWWLPQRGKIDSRSIYAVTSIDLQWYVNGNGVVLYFGAKKQNPLIPGLYIPDAEWVLEMRQAEAHITNERIGTEFDDLLFQKFQDHLKQRIRTRLPKFISNAFKGYVLSPCYESDWSKIDAIKLEPFNLELLSGIHGLEKIVEEISPTAVS